MEDGQKIHVSGAIYTDPVCKLIERLDDGSLKRESQAHRRGNSVAEVINARYETAAEAFEGRLSADCYTMFLAGTFEDHIDPGGKRVVSKAVFARRFLEGENVSGFITASKEYLAFREGAGILRGDVDRKEPHQVAALWPEDPFRLREIDEVRAAVLEMLPEARGCPMMIMPSGSSMIIDEETGDEVIGPGGWRFLLVVDDAREIPRILDVVHRRCWARGKFRYAFLSDNGAFHPRSLVDKAMDRPTQPDYGAPELDGGLVKVPDAHAIFHVDGEYLDCASVVLAEEDALAAADNIAAARAVLEPRSAQLRKTAIRADVERAVKRGVPRRRAERAAVKKFESGILLASDVIRLEDGSEVPAAALFGPGGEKYDGAVCFDPIDPGYDGGRPVGIIYWNEGLRPGVHSFAHGSKFWKVMHDAESAAAAMDAAGPDAELIALVIAQADVNQAEAKMLEKHGAKLLGLGNGVRALRAVVAEQRERIREQGGGAEGGRGDERSGPVPLHLPLVRYSFPRIEVLEGGSIKVLDHVDNVGHMLEAYGVSFRYNVITKSVDWRHPDIDQGGDNGETVLLSNVLSLCALNKVPAINLTTHMTALAAAREYNPVVEYLSALEWDGKPRFGRLSEVMKAADGEISEIVMRLFLIEACAGADNAELARALNGDVMPTFEGTLVPVGFQGAGKTKGLRRLLPPALRQYFKEGVTLDLRNKDSVTAALSCWIAELGELEGTFRKSDIAELKSFISRDIDEIRPPYGRKSSKFARRTVFTGTVNDRSFLADETGNRRFWPLTVERIDVAWSDDELDQLWAEAWTRYARGEQWWPTPAEEHLLAANTERYRIRSGLEEALESGFEWGRKPNMKAGRRTATEVYSLVACSAVGPLTLLAMKTIGTTLARLWRESGQAELVDGVQMVKAGNGDMVKVNATGKNRGWLLPPFKEDKSRPWLTVLDGGLSEEEK